MNISQYIIDNREEHTRRSPAIICNSGLKLSVQASRYHYCDPKSDIGPWEEVEVGYPSRKIDELIHYAENEDEPTNTIYLHVPVRLVEKIIEENGGLYSAPDINSAYKPNFPAINRILANSEPSEIGGIPFPDFRDDSDSQ